MSVTAIKDNIVALIAALDPPIVPTSTLAAPVAPGATSVEVANCLTASSVSRFRPRGRLRFYDGSGEGTLAIKDVAVNTPSAGITTLTLDFDSAPLAGVHFAHTAGTAVYTNLVPFAPADGSAGLVLGDPLICVSINRKEAGRSGMRFGFPVYLVTLSYERRFSRPDPAANQLPIDADTWAEMQEDAAHADLETIETLLLENQELITDFSPAVAEQFGALGQTQQLIVTEWAIQPGEGTTWSLCSYSLIKVLGEGVTQS